MKLAEIIVKIIDNQQQIDAHGKLNDELLKKINYKFRLDWNYYSNHMEGGTLTRDETRSVMIGNIEIRGKSLKDVMEMNGHDKAVIDLLKIGKGEQRFSEKRIKQLHKTIMYEDDSEKVRLVGEWKEKANEIINYKGEKIDFTPPDEVKIQMHQLLDSINATLDKVHNGKLDTHPLIIATQFHIDFVSIHPFYDGNGRMSRILTNLLLISFGYPPVIIKDQHKDRYNSLLADIQAYGGKTDLFYEFIGERLLESQELILKALSGESIEDNDDLDKEIDLWIRQEEAEKTEVIKRSDSLIISTYENTLKPLFELFIARHRKLDRLFSEMRVTNQIGNYGLVCSTIEKFDNFFELKKELSKFNKMIERSEIDSNDAEIQREHIVYGYTNEIIDNQSTKEFGLRIYFSGYKNNGINLFDVSAEFSVQFDEYYYRILHRNRTQEYFRKLYSEQLTPQEIDKFVKDRLKETFEEIKRRKEELSNT